MENDNETNSIIDAIREYMLDCPFIDENGSINVDYLPNEPTEYSIEPTPATRILNRYIDGTTERQQLFNFTSREYHNNEVVQNIANSKFYEDFEKWLENQSRKGILPKLGKKQEATRIEALSNGYLFSSNNSLENAKYVIQCRLEYTQYK